MTVRQLLYHKRPHGQAQLWIDNGTHKGRFSGKAFSRVRTWRVGEVSAVGVPGAARGEVESLVPSWLSLARKAFSAPGYSTRASRRG